MATNGRKWSCPASKSTLNLPKSIRSGHQREKKQKKIKPKRRKKTALGHMRPLSLREETKDPTKIKSSMVTYHLSSKTHKISVIPNLSTFIFSPFISFNPQQSPLCPFTPLPHIHPPSPHTLIPPAAEREPHHPINQPETLGTRTQTIAHLPAKKRERKEKREEKKKKATQTVRAGTQASSTLQCSHGTSQRACARMRKACWVGCN